MRTVFNGVFIRVSFISLESESCLDQLPVHVLPVRVLLVRVLLVHILLVRVLLVQSSPVQSAKYHMPVQNHENDPEPTICIECL